MVHELTVILQHEIETPPGSVTEWLTANKMDYKICKMFNGDPLPQLLDFSNLVICGGSMNVDEELKFPWMTTEKKLIKEAIAARKKVLGLCLGSQLIAEVLGASVGPMKQTESGWQRVRILPNEIAGTQSKKISVFQWHSYCFGAVPGAKEFATNETWKHQAYTYQDNVMAFQFHPETTAEWAIKCAKDKHLPKGPYCQTAEQMLENLYLQKPLQQWFFSTLTSFFRAGREDHADRG